MITGLSKEQLTAVEELCREARIEECEAKEILQQCDWNLQLALKRQQIEGEKHHERNPSTSGELATKRIPNHGYSFSLPDFDRFPADFRAFLEKELIEMSTQRRLENSKHLNWWTPYGQKLYALSTTGDGNCLLHAASLGMWGLHDRQLTLREALYEILVRGSRKSALWRRWKWAEHKAIQSSELNLALSDEEWTAEWNALVGLASPVPRKCEDTTSNATDQIYESLEAFHVFVLAHVLKRPIVVISDTVLRNAKGEELSPVSFGGIYLPLECPVEHCHRSPLCLCYDSAHFSPLVPMRNELPRQQLIPVMTCDRRLLPVHFAIDPGPDFTWWCDEEDDKIAQRLELSDAHKLTLISQYMDLIRLDVRRGSIKRTREVHTPQNEKSKSLTIACSGIVNGNGPEKNRLQIEIKQIRDKLKRTLRINRDEKKDKKSIDARSCADGLSKEKCVVAAKLVCSSHEYMEGMLKEYIRRARERFTSHTHEQRGSNGSSGVQKREEAENKRMSRSFSASSIPITCINEECKQPALQSNNFLCASCFSQQKELMTSFNCGSANGQGGDVSTPLRHIPFTNGCTNFTNGAATTTTKKSSTMPSISAHATNGTVYHPPALSEAVPSTGETLISLAEASSYPNSINGGSPVKRPHSKDGASMSGDIQGAIGEETQKIVGQRLDGRDSREGSERGESPRKKPVLDVTLNGQQTSTSVSTIEDEFGITYYSLSDCSVSAHSPHDVCPRNSASTTTNANDANANGNSINGSS